MPDDLNQKLTAIERSGKARFGEEDWNASIEAVQRAVKQVAPGGGLSPADMEAITKNVDPAGTLMQIGRHQLMNEASEGNKESETAYTRLRQKERKAHAEYKGRGWQE
jgi:hypothetical protein